MRIWRNNKILIHVLFNADNTRTSLTAAHSSTDYGDRLFSLYEGIIMVCPTNPISQPSLDISSIWIPLISNEVANSQKKPIACKTPI
jgi:hypothetical protein